MNKEQPYISRSRKSYKVTILRYQVTNKSCAWWLEALLTISCTKHLRGTLNAPLNLRHKIIIIFVRVQYRVTTFGYRSPCVLTRWVSLRKVILSKFQATSTSKYQQLYCITKNSYPLNQNVWES